MCASGLRTPFSWFLAEIAASASDWSPKRSKYTAAMSPNTPAKPPGMSPSSLTYEHLSSVSPISWLGSVFIFSMPITSACFTRPEPTASSAAQIAAEPVAQAFSTRTAGTWRNSGIATPGSAPLKSCRTKPPLKWPTKMPSMSDSCSPALATAGSVASRISCSRSTASSLPKGVWPQPMMCALFMVCLVGGMRGSSAGSFDEPGSEGIARSVRGFCAARPRRGTHAAARQCRNRFICWPGEAVARDPWVCCRASRCPDGRRSTRVAHAIHR